MKKGGFNSENRNRGLVELLFTRCCQYTLKRLDSSILNVKRVRVINSGFLQGYSGIEKKDPRLFC